MLLCGLGSRSRVSADDREYLRVRVSARGVHIGSWSVVSVVMEVVEEASLLAVSRNT